MLTTEAGHDTHTHAQKGHMGCAELAVAYIHQVTQVELLGWLKYTTESRDTVGSGRLSRPPPLLSTEVCVLGCEWGPAASPSGGPPVGEGHRGHHLPWAPFLTALAPVVEPPAL